MAVAAAMGATLMKAAYSPNIKDRGDCSTAIFEAAGRAVAQAPPIPVAWAESRFSLRDSLGQGWNYIH